MPAAVLLGFDESTTKTGAGVRAADGRQQYAAVDNRGATNWHGQPAFDLAELPGLLLESLELLERDGWQFAHGQGALSFSVRQHDMVVLDGDDRLLLPALSWQCNAAAAQVAALRQAGAEAIVGRIEERFILPKLMWVLEQQPALRDRVASVMTTGDYIAYRLTGRRRLSTSDALSNALLTQSEKRLAADVIERAELNMAWFPEVIQSGTIFGTVAPGKAGEDAAWRLLAERLAGWQVAAGLGDNHATGVGCGGLVDDATIVVSAGTSGTINRRIRPDVPLRGEAACFEFYDDRLLLMMLADCGAWYARFRQQFGQGTGHGELNGLALAADPARIRRVRHRADQPDAARREVYPPDWDAMTLGERTASTQFSIVAELLRHAQAMLAEADGAPPVRRFVLTGGLSESPMMQEVFHAGVQVLVPGAEVLVAAQGDELSHQTAAYGALINALLPQRGGDLAAICRELCPLTACGRADARRHEQFGQLIRSALGNS
jgi:sugar (pentulose or hexulose) kinase